MLSPIEKFNLGLCTISEKDTENILAHSIVL